MCHGNKKKVESSTGKLWEKETINIKVMVTSSHFINKLIPNL